MPVELWAEAIALARAYGTYRVSRALRVSYESLARRLVGAAGEGTRQLISGGFVEMRAGDLIGAATVIEVADADGARMTMRLGSGKQVDAAALLSAFRRRDA
jgi:hypothetical protein